MQRAISKLKWPYQRQTTIFLGLLTIGHIQMILVSTLHLWWRRWWRMMMNWWMMMTIRMVKMDQKNVENGDNNDWWWLDYYWPFPEPHDSKRHIFLPNSIARATNTDHIHRPHSASRPRQCLEHPAYRISDSGRDWYWSNASWSKGDRYSSARSIFQHHVQQRVRCASPPPSRGSVCGDLCECKLRDRPIDSYGRLRYPIDSYSFQAN